MAAGAYKVLFICTGNAARSILAEALLNHGGHGRFLGFSAGLRPAKLVNRYALELLEQQRIPTEPLYCKSWDEFAAPDTPVMDCIIVLSNRLPGKRHPVWPGQPVTVHWGMYDPASVRGSAEKKRRAFLQTFEVLQARIDYLVSLPVDRLDWQKIREELDSIAKLPVHIGH
jgi:arsenate reductase (thioredoxin)